MRSPDSPELRERPASLAAASATALVNAAKVYAGLALLALMCFAVSAAMLAAGVLLPRRRRRAFARAAIFTMFRSHLRAMECIGVLRLDLSCLDSLRDAPALIIAPNHPSSIDAALMLSRVAGLTCIMKADVLQNVLFGFGARMAGYITTDPVRCMVRSAVEDLRGGRHLLLFPEGTRTQELPLNRLQRTAGLIAKRAHVPVQAVIIESNSAFLGKGWPLLRIPNLPMEYKMRLGRRFDAPDDVDEFADQLERYFREELSQARLPALPFQHPASLR